MASHAIRDGYRSTPVMDWSVYEIVRHFDAVIRWYVFDGVEKMVMPGKQRTVIARRSGATRKEPARLLSGMQSPVHEPAPPEVVLEMVFRHASDHYRESAFLEFINLLLFAFYE